jgi:hypothetical protein
LATTYDQYLPAITASAVISKQPGSVLRGVMINSCAATATIQLWDGGTVAAPINAIGGLWTPGAIVVPTFIPFGSGIILNVGLVVIIAVSAANLTLIGRFSQ